MSLPETVLASPPRRRRPPTILLAALLVAGLAAAAGTGAATISQRQPLVVEPVIAAAAPAEVVVPPTTVAPKPPPKKGPIDVPADPYAPEEVVRIGTLEIPKLGVSQPLMHGVTLRNIDNGPSHWPGTAMPGEVGNVVVAGHRVTHSHPFRDIDQLKAGDELWFFVDGVKSIYRLTSMQVVFPSDTWIANPTDTAQATIFACHPPHSAKQRIVGHFDFVRSEPAPAPS